jgi:hypothetical protein
LLEMMSSLFTEVEEQRNTYCLPTIPSVKQKSLLPLHGPQEA